MSTSSPEHFYLLFAKSDDFETQDKILYALANEPEDAIQSPCCFTLKEALRRKMLIRSVSELKSGIVGHVDLCSSPVLQHSPADTLKPDWELRSPSQLSPKRRPKEKHNVILDNGSEAVSGKSYSDGPLQNWTNPLEVLYQNYHLHLVIDFTRAFDCSPNGTVFYDRVPDVVQAVMSSFHAFHAEREKNFQKIASWLSTSPLESEKEVIMKQVWNPHVVVSITLINVPWDTNNDTLKKDQFISDVKNGSSDPGCMSMIPIFTREEATNFSRDSHLLEELEKTLAAYEKVSRSFASSFPILPLDSTIEYLVRCAPHTSKYCESMVLIANVNKCSCPYSFSFLEGAVYRKNLILSVVTLNCDVALDSPDVYFLAHFIHRIGGFLVNVDYWCALAAPQLNTEWARNMEGCCCLTQQLFVHLVLSFPRRARTPRCPSLGGLLLYDESNGLRVKSCPDREAALAILQTAASVRFNESWRSLICYNETDGTGQLLSRFVRYFHQGFLTLEYELNILPSLCYRQVRVRGKGPLLEQFRQVRDNKMEGLEKTGPMGMANWIAHGESFYQHIEEALQGEEVVLKLMLENVYSRDLLQLCSGPGVYYKWFNFAAVRSIAVCYEISSQNDNSQIIEEGSLNALESPATELICQIMRENQYVRVFCEKNFGFISQRERSISYFVQFFPICGSEGEYKYCPAESFECRISFFFGSAEKRKEELEFLASILNVPWTSTTSSDNSVTTLGLDSHRPASPIANGHESYRLRAYSLKESQRILGVMFDLASPCFELPSVGVTSPILASRSTMWMKVPYPPPTFDIKKAYTFHWQFKATSPYLASRFFTLAVFRRCSAFNGLLILNDSLKALLERKKVKDDDLFELDYINASSPYKTIHVTRVIGRMSNREEKILREDMIEDSKVFSALSTFLDTISLENTSKPWKMCLEALVSFIPIDDTEIVELFSPQTLGADGVVLLRERLLSDFSAWDGSQIVDIRLFHPSFLKRLLPQEWEKMNLHGIAVSAQVVKTNAIPSGFIVFAVMVADEVFSSTNARVEDSKNSEEDPQPPYRLTVALAHTNYDRLSLEIARHHQHHLPIGKDWKRDCPSGRRLQQEVKSALTASASTHSASRLLQYFAVEDKTSSLSQSSVRDALDETNVMDIIRVTEHLHVFAHDIDITPLLYVVECITLSRPQGSEDLASEQLTVERVLAMVQEALSGVILRISRSYDPLPSLCFLHENVFSEVSKDHHGVHHIPVVMKCAARLSCGEETEEHCFWINGTPSAGHHYASEQLEQPWKDNDSLVCENKSIKTLRLRVFALSSALDENESVKKSGSSFNLISELIKETPPLPEWFSSHSDLIQLDGFNPNSLVSIKLMHLMNLITDEVMHFCLHWSFRHQSYAAIQQLVKNSEPEKVKKTSVLRQATVECCTRISEVAGLPTLLHRVVLPCLFATTRLSKWSEAVEYTQTSPHFSPMGDVLEIFHQWMKEERIALLPIHENLRHIFIPNQSMSSDLWVLVDLELKEEEKADVLVYWCALDEPAAQSGARLCQALSDFIKNKMTQIYQLRLLKELRHSQRSVEKLIPVRWGDQFTVDAHERQMQLRSSTRRGQSAPVPALSLHGKTILELPLYYKLQNQCSRVLILIGRQCPRLELIPIYNQRQCFIVADDLMVDTFHFIRLVFLPNTASGVLATEPSPPLSSTDRCSRLIVQLFSVTSNPIVERPLKKLQSFCYFLAVQELQGQLNYTANLSFNDLLFLQNRRVVSYTIPYAIGDGESCTDEDKNALLSTESSSISHPVEAMLTLSFVVLHLRENNFKYFDLSNEQYTAMSDFVDHYHLGRQAEIMRDGPNGKQGVWRFVKLSEEVKDVLVSCLLYVDSSIRSVILQPFLTNPPAERYTGGESEKKVLQELESNVKDSTTQAAFCMAMKEVGKKLPLSLLRSSIHRLLEVSCAMTLTESVFLRHKSFSLEDISVATLPMLVECLCGSVAAFLPSCFLCVGEDTLCLPEGDGRVEEKTGDNPVFLPSFAWKWFEEIQNHPLADCLEFIIVCGVQVVMPTGILAPPTKVVPHGYPQIPITNTKLDESKEGILKPLGLSPHMENHIFIQLNMAKEELRVTLFNIRDSENILKLMEEHVGEMVVKTDLLRSVLLQRTRIKLRGSNLTEGDLSSNCCGNSTNITPDRKICVDAHIYRRPIKNLRFAARLVHFPLVSPSNASLSYTKEEVLQEHNRFFVMIEGLHNRGLVINGIFSLDDGIKVLFDEFAELSLSKSEKIIYTFFQNGFLEIEKSAVVLPQLSLQRKNGGLRPSTVGYRSVFQQRFPKYQTKAINCRFLYRHSSGWACGTLIPCLYRRHIFFSHVILEIQNVRARIRDMLSNCEVLLQNRGDAESTELAKCIIGLQAKSKLIYGTRVPDFLFCQHAAKPSNDIHDENIPVKSTETSKLANAVNDLLHNFSIHLCQVFPDAHMIDLDPCSEFVISEPVIMNRMKNCYGEVQRNDGSVFLFYPHLFYVVIPLFSLLTSIGEQTEIQKCRHESPVTSSGLFILEIGFRATHYALDVFSIDGNALSPTMAARLSMELRSRLDFESAIYDHVVHQMTFFLRHSSSVLPEHHLLTEALSNMTSYYPFAPWEAQTSASAYFMNETFMLHRKSDTPSNDGTEREAVSAPSPRDTCVPLLPDKDKDLLTNSSGQHVYRFCGIVAWKARGSPRGEPLQNREAPLLYVLLEPASSLFSHEVSAPRGVLRDFQQRAKKKLMWQLHRTTHQQRLDSVWRKFVCALEAFLPPVPPRLLPSPPIPTMEEYTLLLRASIKIVLPQALKEIQELMESVDWPMHPGHCMINVVEVHFPSYVLQVVQRPMKSDLQGFPVSEPKDVPELSIIGRSRSMLDNTSVRKIVFTLAPYQELGNSFFLSVECWCHFSSWDSCSTVYVEEVSIVRRVVPTNAGKAASLGTLVSGRVAITPRETELVHVFHQVLVHGMWAVLLERS